jgi:methionyl-tRNA formyltransferase
MKVLLLSPYPDGVVPAFGNDQVTVGDAPLSVDMPAFVAADFVVCYGYRHIIRPPVLAAKPGCIVNLHISYLPWNRGSDPNLWSVVQNTPAGITIHLVDQGVDTGPLLAQRRIEHEAGDTLATSYWRLRHAIEALFVETWPAIRNGKIGPRAQEGTGTVHRSRDKEPLMALLPGGWDTSLEEVRRIAIQHGFSE